MLAVPSGLTSDSLKGRHFHIVPDECNFGNTELGEEEL